MRGVHRAFLQAGNMCTQVEEEQPRTVAMDEWEEAKPSVGRGTPGDDDEKCACRQPCHNISVLLRDLALDSHHGAF